MLSNGEIKFLAKKNVLMFIIKFVHAFENEIKNQGKVLMKSRKLIFIFEKSVFSIQNKLRSMCLYGRERGRCVIFKHICRFG